MCGGATEEIARGNALLEVEVKHILKLTLHPIYLTLKNIFL